MLWNIFWNTMMLLVTYFKSLGSSSMEEMRLFLFALYITLGFYCNNVNFNNKVLEAIGLDSLLLLYLQLFNKNRGVIGPVQIWVG